MRKHIFLLAFLLFFSLVFGFFFSNKRPLLKKIQPDRIFINKSAKTLDLYKNNQKHTYFIATGKNIGDKQKEGDCRTPVGRFKIVKIQKSDTWAYDFEDDDKGPIVGAYGPWFLLFNGPWVGIAIHGTHDPDSIGTNATHGCIRMKNKELEQLKELVTLNFPVEVVE